MLDLVEADQLTVIANTGDDLEIYGAHVSPDPDLITFWLADRIDPRGWGLEGDTFTVMECLRELGEEIWFNLGDRDLAIGIQRAQALADGARLTDAHAALVEQLGVRATVLPMSDRPIRTRVMAADRWWTLQEYLITAREPETGWPALQGVQFRGVEVAGTTPEVLRAIASARAIVIGPSNPVISIGPMLALPVLRAALVAARSPIVAVSPLIDGRAIKGPTADCMRWCGVPVSNAGISRLYDGLIDGLVCDEQLDSPATLSTDLLMDGAAGRRRLASETLTFAANLTPCPGRRGPTPSRFLPA
jgi:LPPG:FO 2-phospho-L-lactate transferase